MCLVAVTALQAQGDAICIQVAPVAAGLRPLYLAVRRDLNMKETIFAGVAGLRGSVCLILAQAVVTEGSSTAGTTAEVGRHGLMLTREPTTVVQHPGILK